MMTDDIGSEKWGEILRKTLMNKKIMEIIAEEFSNAFTLIFDDGSTLEVSTSYRIRNNDCESFSYYNVNILLNNRKLFSTMGGRWYPD